MVCGMFFVNCTLYARAHFPLETAHPPRIIGMCCRNATIPAMNAAAEFFLQSASAYFAGVSFKWPFAV